MPTNYRKTRKLTVFYEISDTLVGDELTGSLASLYEQISGFFGTPNFCTLHPEGWEYFTTIEELDTGQDPATRPRKVGETAEGKPLWNRPLSKGPENLKTYARATFEAMGFTVCNVELEDVR